MRMVKVDMLGTEEKHAEEHKATEGSDKSRECVIPTKYTACKPPLPSCHMDCSYHACAGINTLPGDFLIYIYICIHIESEFIDQTFFTYRVLYLNRRPTTPNRNSMGHF